MPPIASKRRRPRARPTPSSRARTRWPARGIPSATPSDILTFGFGWNPSRKNETLAMAPTSKECMGTVEVEAEERIVRGENGPFFQPPSFSVLTTTITSSPCQPLSTSDDVLTAREAVAISRRARAVTIVSSVGDSVKHVPCFGGARPASSRCPGTAKALPTASPTSSAGSSGSHRTPSSSPSAEPSRALRAGRSGVFVLVQ
ncbi:hypothetical protein RJ55_02877 [Drechmeria coniospora]|nr:hypothetical protein RJ55_02877 [Drechmeria coniospora]